MESSTGGGANGFWSRSLGSKNPGQSTPENGKPYYDPSEIAVPTLVILAEWDQDTPLYMAQEVFQKLTRPKVKRMVVIGEGTHAVALEKNRMQLFRETALFLEEEH